ncbi:hypothetical protein H1Q63_20695 [Desmonostoc muscorum CCALA 125]|nr:hypothetical protein [Desmonostoc muscorum CCALA 125]
MLSAKVKDIESDRLLRLSRWYNRSNTKDINQQNNPIFGSIPGLDD